jgi:hypothetical protein
MTPWERGANVNIDDALGRPRTALRMCAPGAVRGRRLAARGSSPPALTPVASVDFAQRVQVRSLVGFLHGLGDNQPPDRMVTPLHPTLWRGSLASASYDRATTLGARYMLVAWGRDRW